jgi:pilus assembly protein Flp/PilA
MMKKMRALFTDEEGQGMTEYGLVLGLIAVGVVAVLITMRTSIVDLFEKAQTALTKATVATTP